MGVAASEIEADEVVTLPTMISRKHLQGEPRHPNTPLQELTQELLSGTKQVMLCSCHTLLCGGGPLTVMVPYYTMIHLKFMVPYLTTPSFTLGIIRTVHLFTCSGVGPFPHTVDVLLFVFVVDALSIKN